MLAKAAIFDLDGTLLDSTGVWRGIDETFLGKRGIAVPDNYFSAVSTMNLRQGAEYTIRRFGFTESPAEIIDEWREMALHAYAETIPLKPGAADFLRRLGTDGWKIALATASDPEYYEPALKRCGVYDCFDLFVHTKPGLYKGNAAFYLHCAEALGIDPGSCVVLEDVPAGVRAAKEAGMLTIAVYDPQSAADREMLEKLADRYILSFSELDGPFDLEILRQDG